MKLNPQVPHPEIDKVWTCRCCYTTYSYSVCKQMGLVKDDGTVECPNRACRYEQKPQLFSLRPTQGGSGAMPSPNSREALQGMVASLMGLGVQQVVQVPSNAKVLVLDFKLNDDTGKLTELNVPETMKAVQEVLQKAGLGHVQVLLTQGLDKVAILK